MVYPVDLKYCYLIEPFGTTAGREFPHTGDDFARRKTDGKPLQERPDIYAAHDGEVVAAGWHAQAGNRTIIAYDHGTFGVYGHQAEMFVKPGGRVTAGQRIGLLGGTGRTSGPHLHYAEYTSLTRAMSGIVQYWKNKGGGILWPSVTSWADASGLIRPNYRLDDKASAPLTDKGFLMALTDDEQAEVLRLLRESAEREKKIDLWVEAVRGDQLDETGQSRAARVHRLMEGMTAKIDTLHTAILGLGNGHYSWLDRIRSVMNELEKKLLKE